MAHLKVVQQIGDKKMHGMANMTQLAICRRVGDGRGGESRGTSICLHLVPMHPEMLKTVCYASYLRTTITSHYCSHLIKAK